MLKDLIKAEIAAISQSESEKIKAEIDANAAKHELYVRGCQALEVMCREAGVTEPVIFSPYESMKHKVASVQFSVEATLFELAVDPYTYRAFLDLVCSDGRKLCVVDFITDRTDDTWGFKSSGRPILNAQTLQNAIVKTCASLIAERQRC